MKLDEIMGKVICGDCLEVMKEIPDKSIDLVLTSPPYNTCRVIENERALNNLENRYIGFQDNKTNDEYIEWTLDIMKNYDRVLIDNGCVLYNLSYSSENLALMWNVVSDVIRKTNLIVADCVIWKKDNALPNNVSKNKLTRIIEYVFVFCRKNEIETFKTNKKESGKSSTGQIYYENIMNLISAPNNDGAEKTHKATFSTEFCGKLMNIYAPEQSIILDNFMGTGTTALACEKYNRRFIGIEISEKYCEIARARIKKEQDQIKMF